MGKKTLLYGIAGLFIGLVIGFVIANNLNADPSEQVVTSAAEQPGSSNLPPNHPPFGQSSGQTIDAPLPEITEAIEKAQKNPQDFEAQMTAGDLFYQVQSLKDAINFYKRAGKLHPNDTEPMIKLGNSYFDLENYVEAEKSYELVLRKTPNDLSVRTDFALTFFLRNPSDLDRAVRELNLNLEINPDHEFTLQNLVAAYSEKGDSSNLQRTIDKLIKVNPNNPALKRIAGK